MCLVCSESQEHQSHSMAPIDDEAFESYGENLVSSNGQDKESHAFTGHGSKGKGTTSGRTRQKIRLRLSAEVAKLHHFLAEEEKLFLQRLSKEEETKKKQTENTLKLHQIITSLKKLILEVGEMSQSPILELLWNPKELLTRSENRDRNYSLQVLKVKTVCHDDEGNAEVIPSGYQFS